MTTLDGVQDGARLTALLEAANAGSGHVQLDGVWDIREPIIWPKGEGLILAGASMRRTVLRWAGPPNVPMFVRRDVRDSLIVNLGVECDTPLLGFSEVGTVDATTPGRIVTSNNHTKRIWIQGHGRMGYYQQYGGLGFDGWQYPDVNNEKNVDEDITVNNMQYGILYAGNQCKANHVVRCDFQGGTTGVSAIKTNGGSFVVTILFGSGFSGAAFDIGNQTDNLIIDSANIETAARFYHSHGPSASNPTTGAPMNVSIRGGRFSTDYLQPDSKGHLSAIWCQDGGVKQVRGIQLGLGDQPIPMIAIDTFKCVFDGSGIEFGSTSSSPGTCWWSGGENYFDIGINVYRDGNGDPYYVRGIPGVTAASRSKDALRARKNFPRGVAK